MKPRYFRLAAVLALSLIFSLPVAQAGAVRLPPRLGASAAGITGGALGTAPNAPGRNAPDRHPLRRHVGVLLPRLVAPVLPAEGY